MLSLFHFGMLESTTIPRGSARTLRTRSYALTTTTALCFMFFPGRQPCLIGLPVLRIAIERPRIVKQQPAHQLFLRTNRNVFHNRILPLSTLQPAQTPGGVKHKATGVTPLPGKPGRLKQVCPIGIRFFVYSIVKARCSNATRFLPISFQKVLLKPLNTCIS